MSSSVGHARPSDAEHDRLVALRAYDILDTPAETGFDDLTALAAYVCEAPMATLGFLDADREWIKACHGIALTEIPREHSLGAHLIGSTAPIWVTDVHADARFAHSPLVNGDPPLRFFAAAPILTATGLVIGALTVLDRVPRPVLAGAERHLQTLAEQVMTMLELRRRNQQASVEAESRRSAAAALRRQLRLLDGVLKHADVLIYAKDIEGRIMMANPAVEHVAQSANLIGRTDYDIYDRAEADRFRRSDVEIMTTQRWQVFSEDIVHPDGTVHTYRTTKFPLIGDTGEVIGVGGMSTDVTELAAARAAHAQAEQRWRALIEQSPVAVVVVDPSGIILYANPAADALCGARIESSQGLELVHPQMREAARAMLADIVSGGPVPRGQRGTLRRRDGTELTVEFNAAAVNHAGVRSVQLEVRDISHLAAAHAALKQSAATDALTGLWNRQAWDQQVSAILADPANAGKPLTIAVIDLDNFKYYNDTRGHTAGDALLQRFAAQAESTLRRDDVLARWGGEEFIIAMPSTTPAQAEAVLQRVKRCVPSGQTCSIGYTAHDGSEPLTDTVIRADTALYQAKRQGRNKLSHL
ncbi:diguanylate cyclase domain-containing protein [Mycobacterium sp. SMC-4]|uniref:diguanylate cyclase domain-containing protein n=1 Tax=Mycobacterium sp. SMC-4 TaxID=2857059 RepID=UPI003D089B01